MRRQHVEELRQAMVTLAAADIPPMSIEEIEAEVKAYATSVGVRAVLDTNVVVAGLLWQGPPQKILLRAMEGKVMLATSPALLSELEGILHRSKFARQIAKQPL